MTRFGLILLGSLVGFYILASLLLYLKQDALLFLPDQSDFSACKGRPDLPLTPVTVEFGGESGSERLRYHSYSHPDPKGLLVVFHGNAGSACNRTYFVDLFRDEPVDIWLAEYPGFAGDAGIASEKTMLPNALALVRHARLKYPPGTKLFLLGESMGSGVATHTTAEEKIDALFLTTPYTSIVEVAAGKIPWLPVSLLSKHSFRAERWAKKVDAPVIILHGTDDPTIPYAIGQAQAKNFPNQPKFISIQGANHNNWLDVDGDRIKREFSGFLRQYL